MTAKRVVPLTVLLLVVSMTSTSLCAGDETNIKGLITGRTADMLTVRTQDGGSQSVILTDDTKVQMPKGLGLRHKGASWTDLIPGLRVNIKGTTNTEGKVVAREISFNNTDLQNATMIQAGLAPTKQQVEANQQNIAENKQAIAANQQATTANREQIEANEQAVDKRFSELADYDVKDKLTVYFPTGSAALQPQFKAALTKLAASASQLQGYIIQVKGYADSSGNAAFNQTLSKDRAYVVIDFLMQNCNVAPRHIVSPGAMGISDPVASNETAQGRAENRRVDVTIMVNKGIAAGM